MLSNDEVITRPKTVLDEWLHKFGMDKNRRTSDSMQHMSYVRVRDVAHNINTTRWVLGDVAANPANALAGAFQVGMTALLDCAGMGNDVVDIDAVLMVSHGKSMFQFIDPANGKRTDFEGLSEAGRVMLRDEDKDTYEFLMKNESEGAESICSARLVNIITNSGLAADVSTWIGDKVTVEVVEKWTGDSESIESGGGMDDALMATFSMLHLTRETIKRDDDLDFGGMMRTAYAMSSDEPQMLSFLLRVIASGVESGLIEKGD